MEAVGRLAGGIAHDFSNVLTVITGACERLQDRVGSVPGAAGDIESILRNSDRAASLTRQLLAFSRQQTLAPQPLDLGVLVRKATHLLKRLIGEHIELAIDLPETRQAVEADPTQIEQVLMNLAINARDAMQDGGSLRITIKRTLVDAQFATSHPPMVAGEFVELEVTDTGTGMSPETVARAFEPFFTTKEPGKGTGLGLATVYGIVKQSGGFVWIDSEVGLGTTFSIFLPPTTARPRVPPNKRASSRAGARSRSTAATSRPLRVPSPPRRACARSRPSCGPCLQVQGLERRFRDQDGQRADCGHVGCRRNEPDQRGRLHELGLVRRIVRMAGCRVGGRSHLRPLHLGQSGLLQRRREDEGVLGSC